MFVGVLTFKSAAPSTAGDKIARLSKACNADSGEALQVRTSFTQLLDEHYSGNQNTMSKQPIPSDKVSKLFRVYSVVQSGAFFEFSLICDLIPCHSCTQLEHRPSSDKFN